MPEKLTVLFFGQFEKILTIEEDLASHMLIGIGQAHDDLGGDGLSASGLTHQSHALTRSHVKGHAVDDIDVAVVVEVDREVLDPQQRRDAQVGYVAIRALELHVAQGSQAAIEALGLLGVSANRVGGENIVGTAGLRVLVIGGDHCAGLGCHGVGEALG